MTNLDRVITVIQREAADIPTHDLRSDIQVGLDVLDAAISDLHGCPFRGLRVERVMRRGARSA